MVAFQKFNNFTDALSKANHNFATASIKVMLTNSAPGATGSITGDITQIGAANGYLSGGTGTPVGLSNSSGAESITGSNAVFTASGGSFGPFEYAVLYNSTSGLLIGWFDYGSAISLNNGETFTITPAGGVWFTIT